ncbi:hypothetical protein LTS18_015000, partial [Coniosporium uncinatum]
NTSVNEEYTSVRKTRPAPISAGSKKHPPPVSRIVRSSPQNPNISPPASAAPAVCPTRYNIPRAKGQIPENMADHVISGLICPPLAGATA